MNNNLRTMVMADLILAGVCAGIGLVVGAVGGNGAEGILSSMRSAYLVVGSLALVMTAVLLITDSPRYEHKFSKPQGGISLTVTTAQIGVWLLLVGIGIDYLERWLFPAGL